MAVGNLVIVLHSHIPYVISHGNWPHGMDWLNEATAETYVPLLDMLYRLVGEGISPKFTISITPVLAEQLASDGFKSEFESYLKSRIDAAKLDKNQFQKVGKLTFSELSEFWKNFYEGVLSSFKFKYSRDIVGAFRELQDKGHIEIMTSAATHAYLPLLSRDESINAQIKQGIATYRKHFHRAPRGIWLPECAYRPRYVWSPPVGPEAGRKKYLRKGIEEFLSEDGISYFIIDVALLRGGKAIGVYIDRFEALKKLWKQFSKGHIEREINFEKDPHEPYVVNSSGEDLSPVAVLTRDSRTALQVWSGEHGYPGDGWYLEFHKKNFPGGHRYWRVTSSKSDLADKKEYDPDMAEARVMENSDHFVSIVREELEKYKDMSGKEGVLCAPYDAELFGHWWFEGIHFLEEICRKIQADSGINLCTGSEAIEVLRPSKVISLPEGSWGEGGYHYIWLNEWTEWTWEHIYEDEAEMISMVKHFRETRNQACLDFLKQAARELFLLQASDWQFLITTWTAKDYAENRLSKHHEYFHALAEIIRNICNRGTVMSAERNFLELCKSRDFLFGEIEPEWFTGEVEES